MIENDTVTHSTEGERVSIFLLRNIAKVIEFQMIRGEKITFGRKYLPVKENTEIYEGESMR